MGLFDFVKEKLEDAADAVSDFADNLGNLKDELVEIAADPELKEAWQDVKDSTKEVAKEVAVGVGIDGRSSERVCLDAKEKVDKILEDYSANQDGTESSEVNLMSLIEGIDGCFMELSRQLNYGANLYLQKDMYTAPDLNNDRLEKVVSYTEGVNPYDVIMMYAPSKFLSISPIGLIFTRDRICFRSKDQIDLDGDFDTWETILFSDIPDGLLLDEISESTDMNDKKSIYLSTTNSGYDLSFGFGINEFRAAIVAYRQLYSFFSEDIELYRSRKEINSNITLHPTRKYDAELIPLFTDLADVKNFDTKKSYYVSPRIPREKIRNAVGNYAHQCRPHEVLLLHDNSILGGAKNGFLITRNGFYSKGVLEKPVQFSFADLKADHDGFRDIDYGENDSVIIRTQKEEIELHIDLSKFEFENLLDSVLKIRKKYPDFVANSVPTPTPSEKDFEVDVDTENENKSYYGVVVASNIETQTQIQKYHNERSGHGFAAEDANALNEKLLFKNVDKIGESNELDGADRITDGVSIQTKYYNSASGSVNSAFRDDKYRYYDSNGNTQLLEVPADQYDEAVKLMEQKIVDSKVPGVTNPDEAKNIVKKSSVTYEQAKNIAKGGNIDSLIFDAKNQIITSATASGVGFCVSLAQGIWSGEDVSNAAESAVIDGLRLGSNAFVTGVVTSQILRTKAAAGMVMPSRSVVKTISKTDLGKTLVEKVAKASTGKALSGAAATNHVAKIVRTNLVVACVTTAATSAPDLYRAAFARNISWKQFSKNLIVNVGVIGGGSAGMGAAALIGGSNPFLLGAMVIVGSQVGGRIGQALGQTLGEDDAQEMLKILNVQVAKLASNYMLSNDEAQSLLWEVMLTTDANWLKAMYALGDNLTREQFVYQYFESYCDYLIEGRGVIELAAKEIDYAFSAGVEATTSEIDTL